MFSRKLLVAALGLALAGTVADASATTATGTVVNKAAAAQTTTATPKVALGHKHLRKMSARQPRLHVSHRAVKQMRIAKAPVGHTTKRVAVSHNLKRNAAKHA